MTLPQGRAGSPEVILDGIPNGFIHDGGRLQFGPDGYLYASTGETGAPELAQDRDSLGGKILRITPDGDPAPGNPDPSSPIWTLGHRNVQGLAFDDDDNLWASEFGESTFDELNLIRKGGNYGWPRFEGRGDDPNLTNPQVVWDTSEASPSGLAYLDGRLWLGALQGERLWRIDVANGRATEPTDFFVGKYGRLRTVVVAPDGNLWVSTSNRDGRATPGPDDDQIIVVDPAELAEALDRRQRATWVTRKPAKAISTHAPSTSPVTSTQLPAAHAAARAATAAAATTTPIGRQPGDQRDQAW